MDELLTTREAAALLGVGTTSIKRWADSGALICVKTAGGHRRFPRRAVESLRRSHGGDGAAVPVAEGAPASPSWIELLVGGTGPREVYRRLADERDARGSWWQVAEVVAQVLAEIGERWARGELSVLQEHLASERLARALARAAETLAPPAGAPTALLLAAEGDDHTLGLALAELVLRENGWITRWGGNRVPRPALLSFLDRAEVTRLVVAASANSSNVGALTEQAAFLGAACDVRGIELILGGSGAWPERLPHGQRLHSFRALAKQATWSIRA